MRDTALVTGACGFLGAKVAERLIASGKDVVALDDLSGGFVENLPEGVNFYHGSILNTELVENIFRHHSPRFVFHLAAYAAEGLSPFIRTFNARNNVEGSEVIINACINHNVECLVFTSSIAVYGSQAPPFMEWIKPDPIDPYGAAKTFTEASLRSATTLHGLNHVIFRPYNIYGPGQNCGDPYRNVVGIFMRACMENKPMTIFGDGNQTRAFSYLDDVAPAIASAVDRPERWNETFNIGGAKECTVRDLSVAVAKSMGLTDWSIINLPERHEAKHAFCNNGRARIAFGDLMPDIPLSEGLARMAAWVKGVGLRESKPFTNIEVTKHLPPSWTNL